ncbi:hypothetical protein CCYA_CCYA09G2536 [Cyanidiococcus yangmingshanensis]|nr:hypothetical protein CCYA_CCYA09G2536 [Cyanidiococcus yangmingshanensis]
MFLLSLPGNERLRERGERRLTAVRPSRLKRAQRSGCPGLVALRPPPGDMHAKKYEEDDRNPYGPDGRKEERTTEINQFGIEQPVLKPLELFQISLFGELRERVEEGDFTYRWQRRETENWPVCPRGLYPENYPVEEVLKSDLKIPTVQEYDIDERVDHIRELVPSILDMLREDGLLKTRDRRGANEGTGTRTRRSRRSGGVPATASERSSAARASRRILESDDEEALFDEVDEEAFGEEITAEDGEPAELDIEDTALLDEDGLSERDLDLEEIIDADDVDLETDYDDVALTEDTSDYEEDVGDEGDGYRFDNLDDEVDEDFDYDGGFGSRATGPVGLSDDFDYD